MILKDQYSQILENIAASCAKARRRPEDVTLIAVTKSATPEQIKEIVEIGARHLGESRVQQLQQRSAQIAEWLSRQQGKTDKPIPAPQDIFWHMIGHLQRNKVKPVMHLCAMIHSVDSLRLAEEIQTAAARGDQPVRVLLEVNVASEDSKYGVAVGAAIHLAEQMDTMDGLQLCGLMCMAPYSDNPEDSRPHFARLRELFEEFRFRKIGGNNFKYLSMGMSGDYTVAIEEGATHIRIGRGLFGEE